MGEERAGLYLRVLGDGVFEGVDVLFINALEDLGLEGLLGEGEDSVLVGGTLPLAKKFLGRESTCAFGRFEIVVWFFGIFPFYVLVDGLVCCHWED